MPTNTLDKIRHSLSCVAVLFGLLGIFVFASFSPSYAWLYLAGLAAPFIYSIVFVYAIAAWSIYSKYYPFLSLGRLSFVECFFPALALVCLIRRGDLFKITVIRCDLAESVVIQGDRRKRLSR